MTTSQTLASLKMFDSIKTLVPFTILLALFIHIPAASAQAGGDAYVTEAEIVTVQRRSLCQILLEQAQEQRKNKVSGKAEACFIEAVKIAEELKQPDLILRALHQQASFYRELNMPDHARSIYAKAHSVFVRKADYRREPIYDLSAQASEEAAIFKEYSELLATFRLLDSQNSNKSNAKNIAVKKLSEDMMALSTKLSENVEQSKARETRLKAESSRSVDVDFGPYMARLQREIKQNWIPLKNDINAGRVVSCFRVNADGSIEKNRIVTASPSWTANQACLMSVEAADHLDPLPIGAPDKIDVQFTWDHNKQ